MREIRELKRRLKNELPGYKGQQRAVPAYRDEGPVDFDALKDPRLSGVLLLLYPEDDGTLHFPLMKRQEYEGTHSGQVSLPGGRMEPHDNTLADTALRETEEEIGVMPSAVDMLGSLSRLYIPPSNYLVTPWIGFSGARPDFTPDPREVKELFSVPLADLLDDTLFKRTDLKVRNLIFKDIPYYYFNNEIVWGATAMILSEFREIMIELGFDEK